MPATGLIAGSVTITVPSVSPSTGLGTPNIVGSPGPNLAKELATAMVTGQMTPTGAAQAQAFYNNLAAVIVAHIKTNALVTGSATVTTAPGVAPVTGIVS